MTPLSKIDFRQLPIRVNWLGWESDTYTLNRNGWTVHASEMYHEMDFDAKTMRITLRDPADKFVIAAQFSIYGRELLFGGERMIFEKLRNQGIDCQKYSANDEFRIIRQISAAEYASWDNLTLSDGLINLPMIEQSQDVVRTMREFRFFSEKEAKTTDLFLPADSIDDHLNKILELQWPQHKEWQKRVVSGDVAAPKIEARIFSIAA